MSADTPNRGLNGAVNLLGPICNPQLCHGSGPTTTCRRAAAATAAQTDVSRRLCHAPTARRPRRLQPRLRFEKIKRKDKGRCRWIVNLLQGKKPPCIGVNKAEQAAAAENCIQFRALPVGLHNRKTSRREASGWLRMRTFQTSKK